MTAADVVAIEPLTAGDIRQIMKIDKQVYPEPWTKRLWNSELGRGTADRRYVVARRATDGQILGYAGMLKMVDDAHVVTVVTDPKCQRGGVGSTLMADLLATAIGWGCTAMTLEVRASNTAAQALYRKFGMAPVGVRKGYYRPENEDALIFWLHDIQDLVLQPDTPVQQLSQDQEVQHGIH